MRSVEVSKVDFTIFTFSFFVQPDSVQTPTMRSGPWLPFIVTAAFSTLGFYWLLYRKRQVRIPTKWKQVGKVEKIVMYPLKSGALRPLSEAKCTETGLVEFDNEKRRSFHDRYSLFHFTWATFRIFVSSLMISFINLFFQIFRYIQP